MRLTGFRLQNFKCFADTGLQELAPLRTVIAGENNSGKSALLNAISVAFENRPHRAATQAENAILPPNSSLTVRFTVEGRELNDLVLRANQSLFLPMQSGVRTANDHEVWWQKLRKRDAIEFEVERGAHGSIAMTRRPSFTLFDISEERMNGVYITPDPIKRSVSLNSAGATGTEDLGIAFARLLMNETYVFGAQRVATDECPVGVNETLATDGHNLAEVLQILQATNDKFGAYMSLVNEVLPTVQRIGSRPVAGNKVQVWISQYADARSDLYQPLRECGTGIGQVLALLYVVATSQHGRTIAIDEPNSFLHPGAMRRLFSVLKRYMKHQFIVSTHSPEVISASAPERILLTRWSDDASQITEVNPSDISQMRQLLAQVGARLSDVFGADYIYWVEGATEEQCIPLILEHFNILPPRGTLVLGLINTGDVLGRKRGIYQRIYKKLSTTNALIPAAIAFLLDREDLSPASMTDIKKESGNLVTFQPRRTYENFLLHTATIEKVLNAEPSPSNKLTQADIEAWLTTSAGGAEYFKPLNAIKFGDPTWMRDVNAPIILRDVFKLRNVEYNKIVHGVALTKALLESVPSEFDELVGTLSATLRNTQVS